MDEKNNLKSDEIDLIEIFQKIWANRKIIYISTGIAFLLGLIVAFGTPKEFRSEMTLYVETGSGSSMNGLLQQFGGLAGLGIGTGAEEEILNPELYPNIVQSTPFLIDVLKEKVTNSDIDSTITIYDYLSNFVKPSVPSVMIGYTIGLPGKIISLFKKKEPKADSLPDINSVPLRWNREQESVIMSLKSRIKVKNETSNNTLHVSTEMPCAIAAAELNHLVYKSLAKYLTDYKIQKAKNDLEFIAKQTSEAQIRYSNAQEKLAYFHDVNRNIVSDQYRIEEERLQNEYTLAFNVYNGLAQKMEQAKIKVQEKTPMFKVLNPAQVPLLKCKPKRSLILIGFLFLGAFIGIGLIILKSINFSQKI